MDDASTVVLDLMMLEELVHLIKEFYHLGDVHKMIHLKVQSAAILGLMTLEELVNMIKEFYPSGAISEVLHLKSMHAVCRVRNKEFEHLILERE